MDVSCTEKPSPKPSLHLLSLPTEMLLEIFSYFSDDTAAVRKILAPVCKDFYELTNDTTLLGELQFYTHCGENNGDIHARLEKFCKFLLALDGRLSHADTLVINMQQHTGHAYHGWPKFCGSATWASLCSKLHSLQTLLIKYADLSSNNFIAALPPTLTHLHLVHCGVGKYSLKAFEDVNFLPQLKCLHFECFVDDMDLELLYLSRAVNKLQSLFLCDLGSTCMAEGLSAVLSHAANLRSLHIELGRVYDDDVGLVMKTITAVCRKLEYLHIIAAEPSDLALLYYGGRLANLKRVVLYVWGGEIISIENIWLLCENLGSSVEVRVILYDGDDRYLDWATRTRKRQCDNLTVETVDYRVGYWPVCIPSGSTAPCAELHGVTRPDISKLCCPCRECKDEVETRWRKKE